MSRIGKRVIIVPEKTGVEVSGGKVLVRGPLGELSRKLDPVIEVKLNGQELSVTINKKTSESKVLWGTYASHISNMISGVNKAFSKTLILEGIGFKSEVKPARPNESGHSGGGDKIVFALGFSHPIEVPIPKTLKVTTEKNVINISGSDKEEVGLFAARLRALKKPEPYKGKGMRYSDEVIRRKQGKKSV